ncbi:hypothetical protein [Hymenobacter terrestris]|uniref:Uncharacterized protein n=1 Tax=Hymenobacter terrestris TaxID=2748310 RepID=A0ABX2PXU6_9BACT|nr:hypothetical protein [Hymenobacter terrestris]NVO83512.1 hypothetical protein [Hymenobacter terrestris]
MMKSIQHLWEIVRKQGAHQRPTRVPMEYIQSLWGDSLDKPTYQDVLDFIEKTKLSDEEHGAFWVALEDESNLEVHQDLEVILTNAEGEEKRIQATSWDEVKEYFRLFSEGRSDFIQ